MVLVDGQGLPLGTMVASAQEAEVHLAEATVETVRIPRRRGRPRKRVREWVADRAYDSDRLRGWLRRRGIRPCIPRRRNRRQRGRPPELSGYRERWVVQHVGGVGERSVIGGMLGELVVRYERKVEMYRAFVLIAFILICLCTFLK
jgi:hypothetical protein